MLQIHRRAVHASTGRIDLALLDNPALGACYDPCREPFRQVAPLEDEPSRLECTVGCERTVDYVAREDMCGEGVRVPEEEGERYSRPVIIVCVGLGEKVNHVSLW